MTTVDLTLTGVPGISAGLSGYLARPCGPVAGAGPWAGVVVVHEAFGVDDVMRRATDRMAAAGYLAVMPDLYSQGGALRCLVRTFKALSAGQGRPFADLEAARRWLAGQADCTGRVGVLGFCLGGGFALATASRGFQAAAANYGLLPADVDGAMRDACPVVASYGAKDRGMRGAAATLETALERAGVPHDVKEYPDAGHSFLNDAPNGPRPMRPLMRVMNVGPEPASAADAWARIEAFFATHLRD